MFDFQSIPVRQQLLDLEDPHLDQKVEAMLERMEAHNLPTKGVNLPYKAFDYHMGMDDAQ